MMQLAKSTKYFELFERRNPGTVRVSTEHSKEKVIVVRCAIFRPATAECRFNLSPPNLFARIDEVGWKHFDEFIEGN
jgi:hypothetical protein